MLTRLLLQQAGWEGAYPRHPVADCEWGKRFCLFFNSLSKIRFSFAQMKLFFKWLFLCKIYTNSLLINNYLKRRFIKSSFWTYFFLPPSTKLSLRPLPLCPTPLLPPFELPSLFVSPHLLHLLWTCLFSRPSHIFSGLFVLFFISLPFTCSCVCFNRVIFYSHLVTISS